MSVTVVTGAARGMGLACAQRLAGSSEHLVLVDIDTEGVGAVAAELGGRAISADISEASAVAEVARVAGGLGPLGRLVHAAGISPSMADVARVMAVDLVGTALLLEAFQPLVVPGAAAVCFASIAPYQLCPGGDPVIDAVIDRPLAADFSECIGRHLASSAEAYSWAKRGVLRLVRREAVLWGSRGGRVNAVSPGLIDTPMNAQEFENQPAMEVMLEATPLGRMGRADEVAAVVGFLLSEEASFISGTDVIVDGAVLPGLAAAYS